MSRPKVAVLTSGGDAPGMNMVLHSVVSAAAQARTTVIGIQSGLKGLAAWETALLHTGVTKAQSSYGGTLLGTSRFEDFFKVEVQTRCADQLKRHNIDGLLVIGGEGSAKAAKALSRYYPRIGFIPSSIDNNVEKTDYSVGFFSALETSVQAIDNIRDSAMAHGRIMLIELMGSTGSALTKFSGRAAVCDILVLNRSQCELKWLLMTLKPILKNQSYALVAIKEQLCEMVPLATALEAELGLEVRATVLGYVPRGGRPCAVDRLLALSLGEAALKAVLQDDAPFQVSWSNGEAVTYAL